MHAGLLRIDVARFTRQETDKLIEAAIHGIELCSLPRCHLPIMPV